MKPLLLLVDLQRDYLATPGLEPAAGALVDQTAALLGAARRLDIPVIHVWTTVEREPDSRMPHWQRLGRWQCVRGTAGHESPPELTPAGTERVVHKHFFNAFGAPTLAPLLEQNGATTLILAGLHLHACVRATALEAYERGFEVWIADDAVASDDPLHAAITRRYLAARAARFFSVAQVVERLASSAQPRPSGGGHAPDPDPDPDPMVIAARRAASSWATQPAAVRAGVLTRLATHLAARPDWATDITRDTGKPIRYATEEVAGTIAQLNAIARRAPAETPTIPAAGSQAHARRCPLGVVALITPWNNPLYLPLGKLGPALLYGNTVVWKPAPAGLGIALRVLQQLQESGLPPGVVQVLPGDRTTAERLMAHPGVDAVTLTGSLAAGYSAQEICARHHRPLQAELGGNNAAIVWSDAELGPAAESIAEGAFALAGQRCTANRRVIVDRRCLEDFLTQITAATARMPSGDPSDPATRIGPMISPEARERVAATIARARSRNWRLILPVADQPVPGGASNGWACHPAVIAVCDDPTDELVQEETFGPVLVVQPADSWAEAIALCNGVRQGLVAALFSSNLERQQSFLREARAGILKLNRSTAGAGVDLPFGGWKASGVGPPEHGEADLEFYTRSQTLYP